MSEEFPRFPPTPTTTLSGLRSERGWLRLGPGKKNPSGQVAKRGNDSPQPPKTHPNLPPPGPPGVSAKDAPPLVHVRQRPSSLRPSVRHLQRPRSRSSSPAKSLPTRAVRARSEVAGPEDTTLRCTLTTYVPAIDVLERERRAKQIRIPGPGLRRQNAKTPLAPNRTVTDG